MQFVADVLISTFYALLVLPYAVAKSLFDLCLCMFIEFAKLLLSLIWVQLMFTKITFTRIILIFLYIGDETMEALYRFAQ